MKGIILFILTSFFIVSCQKKQYHKNVFILENGELSKLVEVLKTKKIKTNFSWSYLLKLKKEPWKKPRRF